MNPLYDGTVYEVPPEPSSLTLMLTGIATVAVYMWYTGLWRNGLRPKTAKPALAKTATYEYCDYERRFAYSFSNLVNALPSTIVPMGSH
jgi:hypothetical protein